jgi:hypothetical protein
MASYALREFNVVNLNRIDALLRTRGIDTPAKLSRPLQVSGDRLGADAVVYGTGGA